MCNCLLHTIIVFFALLVATRPLVPQDVPLPRQLPGNTTQFTILATNDIHSSNEGTGPDAYFTPEHDNDPVLGNLARLASLLEIERQKGIPTLTVDAGDFSEPTLLDEISPIAESLDCIYVNLKFYARAKYRAVAVGNHECFLRPEQLGSLLERAAHEKHEITLLATNLIFEPSHWARVLKFVHGNETVSIRKHIITQVGDIKVGMIGVWGMDALRVSKQYSVDVVGSDGGLSGIARAIQPHIDALRDKVDVVVMLLHGGRGDDNEDGRLTHLLSGLHVIIAGHTHERYIRAVPDRDGHPVIITQTGYHGTHAGVLRLAFNHETKSVGVVHAELQPVDDHLSLDPIVQGDIDQRKAMATRHEGVIERYNKHVFTLVSKDIPKKETWETTTHPMAMLITDAIQSITGADVSFFGWAQVGDGLMRVDGNSTVFRLSDIYHRISAGSQVCLYRLSCRSMRLLVGGAGIVPKLISPILGSTFSSSLHYTQPAIPLLGDGLRLLWDDIVIGNVTCGDGMVTVASSAHVLTQIGSINRKLPHSLCATPLDMQGKPVSLDMSQKQLEKRLGIGKMEYELLAQHLEEIRYL